MGKSNYSCWDDAVFECRNKNYGAFSLRSKYPMIKSFAAFLVLFTFLAGMIGPGLFREKEIQNHIVKQVKVLNYNELTAPPPIEKIYIPPKKVVVQKVQVKKYVAPVVTKEEVKEPEEIMTVKEVKETPSATADAGEGDGDFVVQAAPPEEVKVVEPPPEEPVVAVPPQFPGGDKALVKFLQKKLKYPPMGYNMNMQGTVVVEFTVDMDGNLSDITVVKSLHSIFDQEALRVIKMMPTWTPGVSNKGAKIVTQRKLPIKFVIQ
jgi:periplasmic protein TonB